jgi:zinc/manganese transport system substrate-binding protein
MRNKWFIALIGLIVIIVIGYVFYKTTKTGGIMQANQSNLGVVKVVAAENFYGDITKQLGGNHVQVDSILSDPNADPHEYESSVQDAEAVSNADIVIENGFDYDTWMDKLLSASPNSNRVVLVMQKLAPHPLPDNPHMWYGVDNVQALAGDIVNALKQKDPNDSAYFESNLQTFDNSLQPIRQKIADIKSKFNGTPVGLTETIYLYQTEPEGLDVLTPFAFEKAIAEGNDPSADDVAKANDQITNKEVKVLIYNEQTITPITTNMQNEAKNLNIPIIPVWETMPTGKHYQSWMMGQLVDLENALQSTK